MQNNLMAFLSVNGLCIYGMELMQDRQQNKRYMGRAWIPIDGDMDKMSALIGDPHELYAHISLERHEDPESGKITYSGSVHDMNRYCWAKIEPGAGETFCIDAGIIMLPAEIKPILKTIPPAWRRHLQEGAA